MRLRGCGPGGGGRGGGIDRDSVSGRITGRGKVSSRGSEGEGGCGGGGGLRCLLLGSGQKGTGKLVARSSPSGPGIP